MLTAVLLALSLTASWNYSVTEVVNAQGVPIRTMHEGDRFAILGSGFGATVGNVVHCWNGDTILQWSDTRIDAVAGPVYNGMHAGFAPVVVHSADGNVELSPFKVELVSVTVRAAPGSTQPAKVPNARSPFDAGLLKFYRGL